MANLNFDQGFPYATYREYISALAATDSVFTTLDEFFFSKPSYLTKNSTATTSQKQGAVTIFDCVDGQIRERHFFPSDFHAFSLALDQRPQNSQTRIIVIGYSRDLFNSKYYEVNKDTLELLGRKYRLHPEIFLWHFTSTSNSRPVRTAFYDTENATFASPLSNRPFFHIQDHSSLVSCCSFNSGREANTVIFFVRDYPFDALHGILRLRLRYLDSPFPLPSPVEENFPPRTCILFEQAMTRLPTKDVLVYSKIPAEFALIYAQISLLRLKDAMDYWVTLIHSDDLGDDHLNQRSVVATIRRNYRTLKDLTSDGSSANWHRLIRDYEQTVLESERQLDLFAQQMSYKASLASLRESRAGIKHAEKGIEHSERGIQLTNRSLEQNARVKRLTQLAFVFIPLSFATSLFGMNLEIFGQGSAQIWMFVVSMVIIYVVVGILWIVFHFWTVFQAFITKVSHDNSRHNPPSANQCQSEATADPLRRSSAN